MLFSMFGININNREQVYPEVGKLQRWMFIKSHTRLPENYDLPGFLDKFFADNNVEILSSSFVDLLFNSLQSETRFSRVLPLLGDKGWPDLLSKVWVDG